MSPRSQGQGRLSSKLFLLASLVVIYSLTNPAECGYGPGVRDDRPKKTSTKAPPVDQDPEQQTYEEQPDTIFAAYDCTSPRQIHDVGFAAVGVCEPYGRVTATNNKTYQILQMEKYLRVNGSACRIVKTQVAKYCGVYDHQTMLPSQSYYDMPMSVSIISCRDMIESLKFNDPNGVSHDLKRNSVTSVRFEAIGRTYIEDGEVKCQGQEWRIGSMIVPRMVVETALKITLTDENILLGENEVTAHTSNIRLNCAQKENGCQTPTVTFLWKPNMDSCPLAVTRISRGTEASNFKGETVFISLDGSLIRLIKQETISMCNRVVYRTNYPDIFLFDTDNPRPFSRAISTGEISITTYINNRDEYLYHYILRQIEEEFQYVLNMDCQRKYQDAKTQFWLQHDNPGLTTWFMGNGTFATSSGEVIYQYQCQPILVRAIEDPNCFQSLPVIPLQTLTDMSTIHPKEEGKTEQLYMEPLTHRLTRRGITIPCSRQFAAKYRNAHGRWMLASPHLHVTNAPQMPKNFEEQRELFPTKPDWSRGGIYTSDEMKNMEEYQDFSRTVTALGAKLAQQVTYYGPMGDIAPHQLFPSLEAQSFFTSIYSRVITFLHAWGETAAVFISLYTIWRLIATLLQWAYNLFILKDVHGCTSQLLWIPCAGLLLMRKYRADYERRQRRQDENEYESDNDENEILDKDEATRDEREQQRHPRIYPKAKRNNQGKKTGIVQFNNGQETVNLNMGQHEK